MAGSGAIRNAARDVLHRMHDPDRTGWEEQDQPCNSAEAGDQAVQTASFVQERGDGLHGTPVAYRQRNANEAFESWRKG